MGIIKIYDKICKILQTCGDKTKKVGNGFGRLFYNFKDTETTHLYTDKCRERCDENRICLLHENRFLNRVGISDSKKNN